MDITHLKQLLEEGNLEESREMLESFFAGEISDKEQTEALVALTTMRLAARNEASREYIEILKHAIEQVKKNQKESAALKDALGLIEVREILGNSTTSSENA